MVKLVTARSGHSVAELIVAVTFLGAALGAVGASTLLGARWTAEAAAREEALEVAAATLDSVAQAPEPVSGALSRGRLDVAWRADGPTIEVRVSDAVTGIDLALLRGRHVPDLPVYPAAPETP